MTPEYWIFFIVAAVFAIVILKTENTRPIDKETEEEES